MAKSELVYEFLGSRNLNTTPIDITGLQGNKYDYELVAFFEVEAASSELQGTFNNDTATNYRKYNLQGDGSSPSASTAETRTAVEWGMNCYSYPTLGIFNITGDSSGERVINGLSSQSSSSGDTRVSQKSMYWKDTLNEITSIQLTKTASVTSNCHIMLYRVPKAANQANWEKVNELTWAAETAEKSFTGLDGNRDKKYKIVWDGDQGLNTQINNDGSSIYTRQNLKNAGGTISAANSTTNISIVGGGDNSEVTINAVTGSNRLCEVTSSTNSSPQQEERAYWYRESVANITSLDCTPAASATGTATLYRMKGNGETSGTLPWDLIESVDINGIDFSAGHTFSNLTGDSEKLYRLEYDGQDSTTSTDLNVQINGDVGSNYTRQYLVGTNTQVAAGATNNTYMEQLTNCRDVNHGNMFLYPSSGSSRPAIGSYYSDENLIRMSAKWWLNSIGEITSLKIFANNASTITGKLKLWRLK